MSPIRKRSHDDFIAFSKAVISWFFCGGKEECEFLEDFELRSGNANGILFEGEFWGRRLPVIAPHELQSRLSTLRSMRWQGNRVVIGETRSLMDYSGIASVGIEDFHILKLQPHNTLLRFSGNYASGGILGSIAIYRNKQAMATEFEEMVRDQFNCATEFAIDHVRDSLALLNHSQRRIAAEKLIAWLEGVRAQS